MEYEAGAFNRIIVGVVDMVAATTEEELCKMTAAEADAFKMLSKMAETEEAPMNIVTREVVLKMVAEAPKMSVGELNSMDSEAGATTAAKASTERERGALSLHMK